MIKETIIVDGMMCANCKATVESTIKHTKGVKSVVVNLASKKASIIFDDKNCSLELIKNNIEHEGYCVIFLNDEEKYNEQKENENKKNTLKIAIIGILSSIVFYASMGTMIGLPFIFYKTNYNLFVLTQLILTIPVICLSLPLFKKGFINFVKFHPSMESLVSLGCVSSFVYSFVLFLININSNNSYHVYFDSTTTILFLIQLGKFLESKALYKSNSSIRDLLNRTPKKCTILKDGVEKEILVREVNVGDILIVKPGDNFAVDGIVVGGLSSVDNSMLTGESIPVDIQIGSNVFAGTNNINGLVKYKATKIGKDTVISSIVSKVEEVQSTKANIENIADKVANYFTKIILLISIISFTIWLIYTKDFSKAINIFVTILVIACPCSLGLATPTAIIVSSGVAAKNKILYKDAQTIENISKCDIFCFDKTGTLTKGEFKVVDVISDHNIVEVLEYAHSLEINSNHPLAKGIVKYCISRNINKYDAKDYKENVSNGITGKINNRIVSINKINLDSKYSYLLTSHLQNTLCVLKENNVEIACFVLEDEIKNDAYKLIEYLKHNNKKVVMITGDNKFNSTKVADDLGISEFYSDITHDQKSLIVETLSSKGKVCYIGDGINDAIALSKASSSISFTNASDIAIDSSSIIITSNELIDIATCLELSKKTFRHIKQNLFFAFFYNSIAICLAISGLINPMIGALAMSMSSISVVLNALRINLFKKEKIWK